MRKFYRKTTDEFGTNGYFKTENQISLNIHQSELLAIKI